MATASAAPAAPPLDPPPNAGPTIEAITALDGAIAAATPNFGPLPKNAENSYLKTHYLPISTLLDAVRDALTAQGVLISSSIQMVTGGFVVRTTLSHATGGWRCSLFPITDPSSPQKVAAAATYGLRINLQQLLAVVGDDDDGNSLSAPPAAPQAWAPPAAPPAAAPPAPPWAPKGPTPPAPPATFPDDEIPY